MTENKRFITNDPYGYSRIFYNHSRLDNKNLCKKLNQLSGEVEDLKQFKKKVFSLLNKYLEEYPYITLTEKWDTNCKYKESCRKNHQMNVAYASRNTLLKELIKELEK